jgi:hypothetical protein
MTAKIRELNVDDLKNVSGGAALAVAPVKQFAASSINVSSVNMLAATSTTISPLRFTSLR